MMPSTYNAAQVAKGPQAALGGALTVSSPNELI